MKTSFKLWSDYNPEAKKNISPDLGMRDWDSLKIEEKEKIWYYFVNKDWFKESSYIYYSIYYLNENNKNQSYGISLLVHGGPHTEATQWGKKFLHCCLKTSFIDFYNIFNQKNQDIVYEMFSILVFNILDVKSLDLSEKARGKKEKEKYLNLAFKKFDEFAKDFNDIFEHFSLNVLLTRNGLVFRQDKKITEDIYVPVLSYLSNKKWAPVNRDFFDAFREFQEKTPQGYSSCITHAISALQGFLQIIVFGKTGKGDLSDLIKSAQKKSLIPDDSFSINVLKEIQSYLMQKRQESGDPHPKIEYANEHIARLVLNLIMIFIQHCIV
ncbi:MAG: hypothetical protein EPN82_15880 [Bacteroidetes bacterium]|nr:MAG: hypothetical protein EPN82_15880 [Bacteroidota bacterium]